VPDILGWQLLNTAVFCAIVACTKRDKGSHLQNRRKTDLVARTVLRLQSSMIIFYFSGQISCKSFSCFLVKIVAKKIHRHVKSFLAKQQSKCDSFFSEITWFWILLWLNYQIWTRCNASLSCVIRINITFHVWNILKFVLIFAVNVDPEQFCPAYTIWDNDSIVIGPEQANLSLFFYFLFLFVLQCKMTLARSWFLKSHYKWANRTKARYYSVFEAFLFAFKTNRTF